MKYKLKRALIIGTVTVAAVTAGAIFCLKKFNQAPELPKYVFLFIGDGMGLAQVAATDSYLAYQDSSFGGSYLSFTKFPVVGLTRTWCAGSGVSDSAAAGTAISCGEKTSQYKIGAAPDCTPLRSMAEDFKKLGYQVGIMSDGPVNHATPAVFYAHVPNRSDYYDISLQIATSAFDFYGGSEIIDRYGRNNDKDDVVKLLEADGNIDFCFGRQELSASQAATKVYLPEESEETIDFDSADRNKNYDLSMAGKGMQDPELIDACLSVFDEDKPFFIMCEQGFIDWASHSGATMRVIESVKLLSKAVEQAYQFYLRHPDETLILVTADHETGAMAFGTKDYRTNWKAIEQAWEELGHDDSSLSKKDYEELNREALVKFGSHSHTGCPVPIYAIGKNAQKFTGFYENSEIKSRIFGN